MLTGLAITLMTGALEIVSAGKPYALNYAPGVYTDSSGPEPFTAPGVFYRGKLTDGVETT